MRSFHHHLDGSFADLDDGDIAGMEVGEDRSLIALYDSGGHLLPRHVIDIDRNAVASTHDADATIVRLDEEGRGIDVGHGIGDTLLLRFHVDPAERGRGHLGIVVPRTRGIDTDVVSHSKLYFVTII